MAEHDVLETAKCLKRNRERILSLWSERARQDIPAAEGKPEPLLRDALPTFLNNLVRAMSPNEPADASVQEAVSKEHAEQRDAQGDYSLKQVLAEYFILQKTIFEVLEVDMARPMSAAERETVTESIAIGIQEAGAKFAELQLERVRRSNESLEHFAHIASHELSEPLRTISGHLTLIERHIGPTLDEPTAKSLTSAVRSARRMKDLIDSVLIYSEVGRAEPKMVSTDFNVAVSLAVENLQAMLEQSGGEVSWGPLPTLKAYPIEISRLFQNLIGNAVKYRGDKVPRVHVAATRETKGWRFSVSDNGVGIPAGQDDRIFKLFSRLPSDGTVSGSGIGLSVCRRVVEAHGGTIGYRPNQGGGTTFEFVIATEEG